MKKKQYIIVGDNNFWYSSFDASTQKEIDDAIIEVKENVGKIEDVDLPKPNKLYVYEVTRHQTIQTEL